MAKKKTKIKFPAGTVIHGDFGDGQQHDHDPEHEHDHDHDHEQCDCGHDHDHGHGHDHGHDHGHHHHGHGHGHHHDHDHEPEAAAAPQKGLARFLYIDPVAGAAGDMFLAALVDVGLDFDALTAELAKLGLAGFRLERQHVHRQSIAGTKVDVHVDDEPHPHRHLGDLLEIIDRAPLAPRVKERAHRVLTLLATAESEAHRMPLEHVHLHEVGALDSLVDVVGSCIGLELLGIDTVVSGPVTLGTGSVGCAHGRMPVPVPGALRILKDFPVRKTVMEGEMTTPTGAALIAGLAIPTIEPLLMIPRRVGYGAGTKDRTEIANLLRVVLADMPAARLKKLVAG